VKTVGTSASVLASAISRADVYVTRIRHRRGETYRGPTHTEGAHTEGARHTEGATHTRGATHTGDTQTQTSLDTVCRKQSRIKISTGGGR